MAQRTGRLTSRFLYGLLTCATCLTGVAQADSPQTVVLEEFESGVAGAVAVTTTNSPASSDSNSVLSAETESASGRLKITDSDGGTNGAALSINAAIPGPGYYLFTADVKVDNASAPIASYGMAVVDGAGSTAEISDINAGYVMNLTGSGDAALEYQTIGAAINVPNTGTFPRAATIYFGTDVSSNSYNAPAADGDFANAHRSNAATWAAGSTNAVYVDNIKRIGPGNMGEERHLWISVGDGFTNLAALESYLVQAKANNFTAVDILARYRADAYYVPNRIDATYANPEPLGTRIGSTPVSADNDPLQYAIDRCRELDLKVYISFSSFLVTPNSTYPSTLPAGSIMGYQPTTGAPRDMVSADNSNEGLWADLGRQDVRDYTKNVLMDIVSNYDIDGVVFDRIRYPGTRFGYNSVALAEMGYATPPSPFSSAFRTSRRNVVGQWLGECYNAITTKKPWVVVGSTPVAFGNSMTDTYNNVFQHWPTWNSQKVSNRTVSFGCMDLMQPQFYRLASSAPPFTAPAANTVLMNKLQYGDTAVDALDFGAMPGAYSMQAPLFYHPSSGDTAQSNANAQNVTDGRALGMTGFGFFAANRTLADMGLMRDPAASSAGTDILAGTPTKVDYLFKSGYDNVPPNAVTNFTATPQSRGSVIFNWSAPAAASDGDTADSYLIYKSTTQPVREVWANQLTKLPVKGGFFNAPVGEAGDYYYKIVPVDDYNNHGASTTVGPYTVAGSGAVPDDIIVDDEQATPTGVWTRGTFSADKYSVSYRFHSAGTGTNNMAFEATIPVSGTWTVSEYHPAGTNRAQDAHHTIVSEDGTDVVLVDQHVNGGKWNPIGSYNFTAGQTYSVTIDDIFTVTPATVVMADAIKWSYEVTPTVAPAQPTNLVATPVSQNEISLTWDDNANNETGYELERTISGGSTVIIQLPADATSYSDSSLAPDTEYHYIIRAYNSGAQSTDSNMASARTLVQIPPDTIIDNPEAVFTGAWSVGTGAGKYGADYRSVSKSSSVGVRTATFSFVPQRTAVYDVYEWHVAGGNRAADAPHTVNHANGSSVVIVDQTLNGSQWHKIGTYLFNGGTTTSVVLGNQYTVGSVMMADAIRIAYNAEPPTTPAAPSNLQAIAISDTEIGLTWSDNAINENSYVIERTAAGGAPEVIASLAADSISYIDTGLTGLTHYSYVVRAVNGQGASANSNTASATTLSSTPADVIIDNLDADLVGPWTISTGSAERYATNYAFRGKSATGANRANFNFTARDTGLYEIFEWHPTGGNRPTDAPHEVTHANGTDTVLVNQRINGGNWNSIGTYAFNGSSTYTVAITDKFIDGTVVMADAIKVVWVDELPANPPAAPSDLTATAVGASQADLSWTDNTSDESAFEIVRNGQVITTVAPNVTSYSDTGLSECTQYTYTVRSVVYGIRSADSNSDSVSLDGTAPVITAPADVTVSTDAGLATASNVALGSASVTDNCDASPAVTNDAPAAFALGQTVVTWTATDAKGNSATATQTVTVEDTEAPAITAPADVTVSTDAGLATASNVALGSPVVSDNADASPAVTNDAPATFALGSTVVTWTVTDAAGNSATATQTVTVSDTENPTITAPADINEAANSNCVGENVALGTPVTADNVGVASVSNDAPATYPVGSTVVTWTVTDAAGNSATATQTVTITSNPAVAPANVTATAIAWDKVQVSWADSSNELGYEVRYATNVSGPYTVAGTVAANVTQYEVTGLLPNTKYFIVVKATNGCGNNDSDVANATTPLYTTKVDNPNVGTNWLIQNDPDAQGGVYAYRNRRSINDPAAWEANLPVDGTYKISMYVPNVSQLSPQATYTIENGGVIKSTSLDQKHNVNAWSVIGTYTLKAGVVNISLFQSSNTTNYIVADGLKIEQVAGGSGN